ncbi:hypothetical protein Q8A73_005970 [Channa argus]|nr:hypothetical protein Q8A73_005970 [Channa argus]
MSRKCVWDFAKKAPESHLAAEERLRTVSVGAKPQVENPTLYIRGGSSPAMPLGLHSPPAPPAQFFLQFHPLTLPTTLNSIPPHYSHYICLPVSSALSQYWAFSVDHVLDCLTEGDHHPMAENNTCCSSVTYPNGIHDLTVWLRLHASNPSHQQCPRRNTVKHKLLMDTEYEEERDDALFGDRGNASSQNPPPHRSPKSTAPFHLMFPAAVTSLIGWTPSASEGKCVVDVSLCILMMTWESAKRGGKHNYTEEELVLSAMNPPHRS